MMNCISSKKNLTDILSGLLSENIQYFHGETLGYK